MISSWLTRRAGASALIMPCSELTRSRIRNMRWPHLMELLKRNALMHSKTQLQKWRNNTENASRLCNVSIWKLKWSLSSHFCAIVCKKEEDKAVSVINACNSATTRGVMVSHYRAFMDAEEDLQAQFEEDMEYVDYDFDYWNFWLNIETHIVVSITL